MLIWAASFLSLFLGFRLLFSGINGFAFGFGAKRETQIIRQTVDLLHEIQQTLETGLVPTPQRWKELRNLGAPWGKLASESLEELRAAGGSVLPTLRRIRSLAEEHRVAIKDARSKSAQALAQALVCAALVPIFGATLYSLLPALNARPWTWLTACAMAALGSIAAALWLLRLAELARWGDLPGAKRSWILASQIALERFLALVRSGTPPDLAWLKSHELLTEEAPSLGAFWGASVWESRPDVGSNHTAMARIISSAGESIRSLIRSSLLEGRPCTERVEGALMALGQDIRAAITHEVSLLQTRALKPLFICVAPSILGLLGFGLFLAWQQMGGAGGLGGTY